MEIMDLVTRAEKFAADSGQSLSTVSRKLLNDGKGLARLKEGGQCTIKTLENALAALTKMDERITSFEETLRCTIADD